ncbi:MAG: hypothetical protein JSR49_01985 [Proteobacteria bacterium]|nr:hypothetical protein [Pseudomonadota bacterium]
MHLGLQRRHGGLHLIGARHGAGVDRCNLEFVMDVSFASITRGSIDSSV